MAEISVIVPVYKVEAFLGRCVDSILSQSFSDFELILVDDGSPDNCGKMCEDYAKQDDRIHAEHGNARRCQHAHGCRYGVVLCKAAHGFPPWCLFQILT